MYESVKAPLLGARCRQDYYAPDTARVLADEFLKRVVIVDTSNEIAGDGDISHLP